jgi:hypothetical protein
MSESKPNAFNTFSTGDWRLERNHPSLQTTVDLAVGYKISSGPGPKPRDIYRLLRLESQMSNRTFE